MRPPPRLEPSRRAVLASGLGLATAALLDDWPGVCAAAEEAFGATGATLCINFGGAALASQSAAFSDFHMSGMNPSGNATLTDSAFVAGRFRVVQTRTLL